MKIKAKGRAAAIVVDYEVADDQCGSGLESVAELGEDRDVVLWSLLMSDTGVDSEVVGGFAEVDGVEVAVEAAEAVSGAALGHEPAGDGVDGGPI